jgi:hypothetical protein
MEERLQKALEFANYRQTLNNQLHKVKIRAEGLLMISKNGGNFDVNQELIAFLDYLVRAGITEVALLDSNKVPVHIDNIADFLKEVTTRYFEVTNDYLKAYKKIRQARNVKTVLDLKDDK